jgi:putative MATE family efflux protein
MGYADISKRLHSGSVLNQLIWMAIPVIGTSFMAMAYNFINIIFVGSLGSHAVAAVGTAGLYMNLSWGLSSLFTVGAGIKVSHAIGKGDLHLARSYVRSGILASIIAAVIFVFLLAFTRDFLIGLIQLHSLFIEKEASSYLLLAGISVLFSFQNLFFTSVFIGSGDSKTPFRINATALAINIMFDYILIFPVGLGINGAAIATILSQGIALILFYIKLKGSASLKPSGVSYKPLLLKEIVGLGISPTLQRVSFTVIAIMMARIISTWGPTAIAVQKVGIQIEAISYMTIAGVLSALAAISGQAYGAKDYAKQWKAFKAGMLLATIIGVFTSTLLIAFPGTLFSIFLHDKESIVMGRDYLIILGFSQLFMCLENTATGAFFGWGKTNVPAISGIILTVMRVPMALLMITFWKHALSSVWWSISISSIAKGTLLVVLYVILFKVFIRKQENELSL